MSRYRTINDLEKAEGKIDRGKGSNNRALCNFCGREVPPGRRKYCGAGCVKEWELRNNPNFLRAELFKLQKGICQNCGVDTIALGKMLKALPPEERRLKMIELEIPAHRNLNRLYDVDHLIPVAFGGGIELDGKPMNIEEFVQILCLPCHRSKTYEMKEELKLQRRAEKKTGKPKAPVRLLRIETK